MSHTGRPHGAGDEAWTNLEQVPQTDGHHAQVTTPAVGRQTRPTGDDAVDDVLARFDAVADQSLDTQIEVGEQVHRVLQGRLADLGKE